MIFAQNCGRPWKVNMQPDESLSQYIARLSALPPRQGLEELRTIQDPIFRRQVVELLPGQVHAEIIAQSFLENLNRNVQERMKARNPKAA